MKLYKVFFLRTGFFCPVCMLGMGIATFRLQEAFNIPLSLQGTSRRTEEHIDKQFFVDGNLNLAENVLKEEGLDLDLRVLLRPAGIFRSPARIKLPDYLEWDYRKIYDTITNELEWSSPEKDAEHTDCIVEPVVQYLRYRKFPAITPELLRFSKLVTCGQMTKSEALKQVEEARQKLGGEPPVLQLFLDSLEITREDFEDVILDPLRHLKYLKGVHPAVRRLKTIKHRLFPS